MRFEDYSKNGIKIAFNCPTNDMANLVFSIFRDLKYVWWGVSSTDKTFWERASSNTWYYVYPDGSITYDYGFRGSCTDVNIFEIENVAEAICKDLFVL